MRNKSGQTTGRRRRPAGFTLIELMVVAAIILVLLTMALPAVRSMLLNTQLTQAENTLRSALTGARVYAFQNRVVAGVRCQDDGQLVTVYARNYGLTYTPDNFTQTPTYEMIAVGGVKPEQMPGPWRVATLDYTRSDLPRTTPHWWSGEQWHLVVVALFTDRGRALQAKCVFPKGWYPTAEGSFGRWTYDVGSGAGPVFAYQGNNGIARQSGGKIAGLTPASGPAVSTDFRIYDYSKVRGPLSHCKVTAQVEAGCDGYGSTPKDYTVYNGDSLVTEAMGAMSASASDFVVDVNTGFVVRKRVEAKTRQN